VNPALECTLAVLLVLGWILASVLGIGHVLRHLRKHRAGATPQRPRPGPVPNYAERQALDGLTRARTIAKPQAVENGRLIADGLRVRFPHLTDTTLGLMLFDVMGYLNAAMLGCPDPRWALGSISDAYALAAEELTRLARQEGVPR
jgi:hypothetical protein